MQNIAELNLRVLIKHKKSSRKHRINTGTEIKNSNLELI
jgi:hypothetical protein